MQDYSNMKRIQARGAEFEQRFYRDMNMKKMFNTNDRNLAYESYSKKYNLNPSYLTAEQRATAETDYKRDKEVFLEGANTYSNFLYENYYETDLFLEDKVQELTEETKSFWEKQKDIAKDLIEIVPTFKKVSWRDEDGKFNPVTGLENQFKAQAEWWANMPVGERPTEIWKGWNRGAIGLIDMAGSAMVEGYEQQKFTIDKLINDLDNTEEFYGDYERWLELKYMTKFKHAGWTDELKSEYKDLNKKYITEYGANMFSNYEKVDKEGAYHPLKILGKSLQLLAKPMIESDTLNTEYSKGVREGTVEISMKDPAFWFNQAPEVIGQVAGLMGMMAFTPAVPDEYAAAGYIIEGLPINVMFSATEANQVREEARASGKYTEEEINEMADTTFGLNLAVQGALGAAPGAVTKLANRTKAYQALMKSNYATRIMARVATVGVDAMFEGIEETLQDEIRNAQLNDNYKFLAEASAETFVLGFLGGLFGGGGVLIQDFSFNKNYNELLEMDGIGSILKETQKQYEAEGKTKLEAKDLAWNDIVESTQGTSIGQELEEKENKIMQEGLINKVLEGAKQLKAQEKNIKIESLKKMNGEERRSQINGVTFSFDKADPNIRVLKGAAITSQVDDNTAITNMVMQQIVKKPSYDNVEYDPKTNTYKSNERVTRFVQEAIDKVESLQSLNELVKSVDESKDVSAIRGYIKKNGLSNNDIHNMYNANAMTTPQYINALRKLNLKPREAQLQKNLDYGNSINRMVNNLSKLDAKDYNDLKKQLIKDFGTESKAIKTLTEIGAITANDGATFRNHSKTLEVEAKDTTKKDLETATKTVETQQEVNKELKETNKKLKVENKQMKMDLADEVIPQRVKSVKEIKVDKTIGKTVEQQKIVKMQEKTQEKQINDIDNVVKKSLTVQAFEKRGVKMSDLAQHYGKVQVENGLYGEGYYFSNSKVKYDDNILGNRNYIDLSKSNMYVPKNKGEAKNLSNLLKQAKELTRIQNELESDFDEDTLKKEIMDLGIELGFNNQKLIKALNSDKNLIESLGYDGVDFKKFQTRTSKDYQTVIFKEVEDTLIKGKDIENDLNEMKKNKDNKKEIIDEIC